MCLLKEDLTDINVRVKTGKDHLFIYTSCEKNRLFLPPCWVLDNRQEDIYTSIEARFIYDTLLQDTSLIDDVTRFIIIGKSNGYTFREIAKELNTGKKKKYSLVCIKRYYDNGITALMMEMKGFGKYVHNAKSKYKDGHLDTKNLLRKLTCAGGKL